MILDFSFEEVMRLSSIKRWGIIEMSRDQSVAEHSFNVAMIASAIADVMDITLRWPVMEWALYHDLTELVTGDIPTPMKKHLGKAIKKMEDEVFPKYSTEKFKTQSIVKGVVKIADWIDAIQFAEKFCVDERCHYVIAEMRHKLTVHMMAMEEKENVPVINAVEKIWPDAKTLSRDI